MQRKDSSTALKHVPLAVPAGAGLMSRIERALPSPSRARLRRQLRQLPSIVHHALGTLYEEPALLMLVISVSGLTGLQHLLPPAASTYRQLSGNFGASRSVLGSLGSRRFLSKSPRRSLEAFGDEPAIEEPERQRSMGFVTAVHMDAKAPLLEVSCAALQQCMPQ